MPLYVFKCLSPEHKREDSRVFEKFIHFRKEPVKVDQSTCPECGFPAPRSYQNEGFTTPGLMPINNSYMGTKGAIAHEVKFAFGVDKKNPDGSVEAGKMPFANTGEMQKYMDGKNTLGPPVCNDEGKPIRKKDGTFMRTGERMFKYGPNSSPSKAFNAPRAGSGGGGSWVGENDAVQYGNSGAALNAPRARTRSR